MFNDIYFWFTNNYQYIVSSFEDSYKNSYDKKYSIIQINKLHMIYIYILSIIDNVIYINYSRNWFM